MLIDLDFTGNFRDQILVEREGFAFLVGLEYENLPHCSACETIGHKITNYRKSKINAVMEQETNNVRVVHTRRPV